MRQLVAKDTEKPSLVECGHAATLEAPAQPITIQFGFVGNSFIVILITVSATMFYIL